METSLLPFIGGTDEYPIVVRGQSFLPSSHFDYDALVTLTSLDGTVEYAQRLATILCEADDTLTFTMPSFEAFFTDETGEPAETKATVEVLYCAVLCSVLY